MAVCLIAAPLLLAGIVFLVPSDRLRPWLTLAGAVLQLALVGQAIWGGGDVAAFDDWLKLDPLGKVVLLLVTVLFFFCALYAPGYLALRPERPTRIVSTCQLLSLAMMTVVALSHHLGLMWVAMEATTLATAPCIYFNHNKRSLEATWKYLLICSVGIALALLGSFFLAYASLVNHRDSSLRFDHFVALDAPYLDPRWLHAAFVLLLVGYGTKMGLAPMHSWKPDAYGEAPGMVGALLAGGLTSCAFMAIVRFYQICLAAGEAAFAQQLLLTLGILSMAIGAVFMVGQRDFKRMLAYSSVEHMGILVIAVGVGGAMAMYGAMLHMVNNGLAKGAMFLSAGNIHRAYGSKSTEKVRGAMRLLPLSGWVFLIGFLAITGSPPFGPFISEFTIVNAALGDQQYVVGGLVLLLLAIVFIGMGVTVLNVVQGEPSEEAARTPYRDGWLTGSPLIGLLALVLLLGLYIPGPLEELLRDAARFMENKP